MAVDLYHGDCLDVMRGMGAASVDAIVTDPPYELGFMGREWDRSGIANDVELWREALRLVKPGGHLLAFGGTRTYHRMTCAIEDAGWQIRDCLAWIYGTGFPKGKTHLKPAHEPIVLARKPGKAVLNIDACRIAAPGGLTSGGAHTGSSPNPMNRLANHVEARPRAQEHEAGRWPANVLLDEEAAAALDAMSGVRRRGGYPPGGGIRLNAVYGRDTAPRKDPNFGASEGGASRFFYVAKASPSERTLPGGTHNPHPCVKPVALLGYLVRLITPDGGTVLDPFCGSGSTGLAAIQHGYSFIGIEQDASYVAIARSRIAAVMEQSA